MWKIKIKDLLDLQGNLGNLVSVWVFSLCWKKTYVLERVIVIHRTCMKSWSCTALHTVTSYTSTKCVLAQQLRRILPAHVCGHTGAWRVTAIRKQRQTAAVLTYRCSQSSNSTSSLGSTAAPSQLSGLNVYKGAELTGLLQWLLYTQEFSHFRSLWAISTRCMRLKRGAKHPTVP